MTGLVMVVPSPPICLQAMLMFKLAKLVSQSMTQARVLQTAATGKSPAPIRLST